MRTTSSSGFDLWETVENLRDSFAPRMPGRMARGDVRTAILTALTEAPMHGYQIIQAVEARSGGTWKLSPGSVYPTLQLLADEGLVTAEQVAERKVYSLTDAGRAVADESSAATPPWESRMARDVEGVKALSTSGAKLAHTLTQFAHGATPEQTDQAVAVIDEARRKLYAILAES
ncbi:PadR family transcriptional regulator [Pseudolysinimonas sp.]|jgi:DNA-binding PadR family transcriptional regulator|uniref:PadR family transcriptional regulator n=1 Tax=Pseudolysinimonas sp. TaxID=2680009 RepID=UPI0037846770